MIFFPVGGGRAGRPGPTGSVWNDSAVYVAPLLLLGSGGGRENNDGGKQR